MQDVTSWSAVASAWAGHVTSVEQFKGPVTQALLAAVDLTPGQTVLELGAGTGALAEELAQHVGADGGVIATDAAEGMVDVMRERLGALSNVDVQLCDASDTRLPAEHVDAAVARMSLMFSADPAAAVREAARVLRPGGRYAAATWAGPFDNIWMSSVGMAAAMNGAIQGISPMDPGGPFSLSEPKELVVLLEDAGFEDVRVDDVALTIAFPDADAHFTHVSQLAGPLAVALAAAPDDVLAGVRRTTAETVARFATDDGIVFPALARVVTGRRPGHSAT
jgi:SAM-dependent methyltransferase